MKEFIDENKFYENRRKARSIKSFVIIIESSKVSKMFRALRFEKIVNVKNIKYEILFKIVANPLLS